MQVKSAVARVAGAAGASVVEVALGLEELRRPSRAVAAVQVRADCEWHVL
jgi:hypothetical protein